MKFSDIITLAKAGYKPGEIKELLELATPEEPEPQPEPVPEPEPAPEPEPEPDYKSLYEESQKKLKAAQKAVIKQPVTPAEEKSIEDILKDVLY